MNYLLPLTILLLSALPVLATSIYVSPDGDDANAGTKAQPFATLARARNAIRGARKEKESTPAVVVVAPGTYDQHSPLVLERQDSNTTYRATKALSSTLSGGLTVDLKDLPKLSDESILKKLPLPMRDDVLVIDLKKRVAGWKIDDPWPDAFRGYAGWPEVFIDGKPLRLARWPNNGYAKIAKVIDPGSRPRFKETPDRPGTFNFKEAEPAIWSTEQEIFLGGYWCHTWYDEVLRVDSIDSKKKTVRFVVPHHYGIGGRSRGRYYSLNVLETLDQAGEYVYDRKAGRIYLLPPEGSTGQCTIGLSKEPLVQIQGAKGIRFEGIQFEAGRAQAIEVTDCTDTVIDGCRLRHFPKTCVTIHDGERCGVVRSELYGLGMGGVSLSGGDRTTLKPSKHFVTDSEVHHYARLVQTYQPAVRIDGVGQYVAYNFFHDAPHQAVHFGGNDHLIEHNRIESVCLDTGDAGAIYCGRDWTLQGNVIQKNWFSQIGKGMSHHNWAIYPDDQSSGITAQYNVIVQCPSGFLFGGGRDNLIKDNLFVKVGNWPIKFDSRGISWKGKHEKTLQGKLAAVPSDKEPWRSRFPMLVGLSTDPKRNWPANNVIQGNVAVSSAPDKVDSKVKQSGKVTDTVHVKSDWSPRLVDGTVVFPEGGPILPIDFDELKVGPRFNR